MNTQNQRVLEVLETGRWLSTVDAVRGMCGGEPILRLGARIWDLKKQGFTIQEERVEGKTYSKYRLIKEPSQLNLI